MALERACLHLDHGTEDPFVTDEQAGSVLRQAGEILIFAALGEDQTDLHNQSLRT